ncbi:hypothetical protein SAMN05428949_5988 [Chitinophaga sp. YR627]|uniref:hypothetical protein n=1 Tax=Chitinophaga sp. YR627 TaxID=1881041 RepID=UPI0008EAF574|nr:hypothetical protein [Chitinophaga sp. YR627]SFO60815.1 hypothetical protein SAMN05428949_5988 [Chitinophaga sp. YR627]
MKKTVLLAISILFISGAAFAQEEKEAAEKKLPNRKGLILNTTLSSLTEPEGGPSVGLEYRLSESVAIGVDATAILYTLPETYEGENGRRGFRIRPEIKLFPSWWSNQHRSFYLSLMGTYRQTSYEDIHYRMPDAVEYLVKYKKRVYAGSANLGLQRYFGAEGRFIMDMYVGVGLRHRRTTPNDSYYSESWETPFFRIDEDGFNPQFAFGFKLGYRF